MRLGNLEIKLTKREEAPIASLAQATTDFLQGNDTSGFTSAGSYIDQTTALNISAVQACVRVLSEDIGMLPVKVYKTVKNGKEEDSTHPLYSILHNKPNEWMTSYVFYRLLMQHLLLFGNFYCEIMYKKGEIVGLLPIHPSLVTVKRTQNGKYFYEISIGNVKKLLQWYYVMHVLGMSDDGINGLNPIEMARKSLGLSLAADTFGSNFFGQGTNMGLVLEHPGKLSTTAQDNLKKSIEQENGGLSNTHKILILEEGMKANKNVINPNDSQFLECVIPGTKISMADGSLCFVENLKKGDEVIAWDNGFKKASVAEVGEAKIKNLVKIKTARGRELTASFDHPCLVLKKLRTDGNRMTDRIPEWIPIGELEIGNYIRSEITGNPLVLDCNIDKGWLIGALTGDGYVRSMGCSFSSNENGVSLKMKQALMDLGGDLKKKSGENCDWEIVTKGIGKSGSKIRTFLNESGLIGKHSDTKRVSKDVMTSGFDVWRGFLSGYFDTDGSIRSIYGKQKPSAYWSSVSKGLLEDCQHLLSMLGIQSSIYKMGNGGKKTIIGIECNTLEGWGLYVIGIGELRKLSKILVLSHQEKKKRLEEYNNSLKSRYTKENFEYDRIISVENIGEGQTIGIEIKDYHTFVTNGLVTHNTRKFQKEDIATLFRVPLHLIQSLDKATNNNIEHQSLDYVTHSLLPWIKNIEQAMMNSLFIYYPDTFPEFTVDALLRGDFKTRMEGYNLGIGNGMYSINECRAKENMNPIENGDEHYIMVNNMAPINTVGQEQTPVQKNEKLEQEMKPEEKKMEKKSIEEPIELRNDNGMLLKDLAIRKSDGLKRNSIRNSFIPVFDAITLEIVKRERADIMRCVEKRLQTKRPKEEIIKGCVETFYLTHPEYIKNKMSALVKGLTRAINDAASGEINGTGFTDEKMQGFVDDFTDKYATKFNERSQGQVRQIVEDSEYGDIKGNLTTRFDEWSLTRPGKTSLEVTVQLAEAVAAMVFFSNLYKVQWSTTSEKPCPICEELNGKIITEGETFAKSGDQILDLQVYQDKTHPPLHEACQCVLIPA